MQVSFAGRNRLKTFDLAAPAKVSNYAKRATVSSFGSEALERPLTTNVCFGSSLIRKPLFRFRPTTEIQTDPLPDRARRRGLRATDRRRQARLHVRNRSLGASRAG